MEKKKKLKAMYNDFNHCGSALSEQNWWHWENGSSVG